MAGWDEVLTALLMERGTALKRYAYVLCGDDRAAEDLLQDALVRALGRPFAGTGRRDASEVEPYVRRIMVNLSIDRHRRSVRLRRFVPLLASRDHVPDPAAGVAAAHDLRTAVAGLSARQRACVVLRYYDDLPVARIADTLGCSEGTVKRHLSDAIARLGSALDPAKAQTGEDAR